MRKNTASQVIVAQLINKADGTPCTSGTTTCYVLGDGGTQAAGSVGSGACTHEGNGLWSYAPAQAETNYDHVAFTFVNTNAVNATIQIYTSFPQTGDNYARLGAPAGASVSADIAAVKTDTGNLVTRITSTLFAGITSLAQWLGLMAGKQVGDSTARTEIRATGAGSGTFDETTDSGEAIRDRGDAAWATGSAAPSASTVASAVRTELATELGRVDVAVSTRNATAPLDAAGTRTAVGLASANLDTQLSAVATASALTTVGSNVTAVKAKTDNLPAAPAATGDIPSAATIAAEVWASVVEGSATALQYMRGFAAVLLGKASGLGTTTAVYRDVPDTKARVTATVDADGNRTAITRDLT